MLCLVTFVDFLPRCLTYSDRRPDETHHYTHGLNIAGKILANVNAQLSKIYNKDWVVLDTLVWKCSIFYLYNSFENQKKLSCTGLLWRNVLIDERDKVNQPLQIHCKYLKKATCWCLMIQRPISGLFTEDFGNQNFDLLCKPWWNPSQNCDINHNHNQIYEVIAAVPAVLVILR